MMTSRSERTSNYSPFLYNVILAIGARYLDPDEDYSPEICGLIGDHDTRGDVFVTWARYLFDQELYNPKVRLSWDKREERS